MIGSRSGLTKYRLRLPTKPSSRAAYTCAITIVTAARAKVILRSAFWPRNSGVWPTITGPTTGNNPSQYCAAIKKNIVITRGATRRVHFLLGMTCPTVLYSPSKHQTVKRVAKFAFFLPSTAARVRNMSQAKTMRPSRPTRLALVIGQPAIENTSSALTEMCGTAAKNIMCDDLP